MNFTSFLVVVLLLVTAGFVPAASDRKTVLSCSFPDSFIAFSVFKFDNTTKQVTQVSPETEGLSFNAEYSQEAGLTYSTDVEGAVRIRSTKRPINISSGASLNDQARWCPMRRSFLFVSTREKNPVHNEGWNAVYKTWFNSTANQLVEPFLRLTPPNETDFSPAWGNKFVNATSGKLLSIVAVASGKGKPGGTNIVVMSVDDELDVVVKRWTVAHNGGYPTFVNTNTLLFHRNNGPSPSDWGIYAVNIFNATPAEGEPKLILNNALTPSISNLIFVPPTPIPNPKMAFAYINQSTGYRNVALYDFATQAVTPVAPMESHQYSPYYDPTTGDVYFHMCRGGSYPNLRRRYVDQRHFPEGNVDLAFASGDFPSISPDNSKVAMIYANFESFLRVDLTDIDGGNRRTLYNATHAWMTSWSNNTIAFTAGEAFASTLDASVQVATVDSNTGVFTQRTFSSHFNQGYPSFSPDGTQIVYRTSAVFDSHGREMSPEEIAASDPGLPGPYHLRIMDVDLNSDVPVSPSSHQKSRAVTTHDVGTSMVIGDVHPNWADGYILFSSDRGHPGQMSIWKVFPNGTGLTEIFNHGANSVHPTMLPGPYPQKIIFTSTIAAYSMEEIVWPSTFFPCAELFVMDADGSNWERLTHDASNQANAWAGTQQLPAQLNPAGKITDCYFPDSTDPPNADISSDKKKKKSKKSGCPVIFKKVAEENAVANNNDESNDDEIEILPDQHAMARKHGVSGTVNSPIEKKKKSGGCPFFGKK
jgi:Tol biopolymer transport system component